MEEMVVSTSRVPRAGNRVKKELPSELRRLITTKRVQLIPGESFLSHPLGVEHPSWSNWTLGWHSRNWDRENWNEGDSSEVHPPTYLCTAFCGIGEIDLTSAASMPGRQMKVCVFVCRSLTTPPHQPPAPQGSVDGRVSFDCHSHGPSQMPSYHPHTYPLVRYSIDIVEEVSMIAEFAIGTNIDEGFPDRPLNHRAWLWIAVHEDPRSGKPQTPTYCLHKLQCRLSGSRQPRLLNAFQLSLKCKPARNICPR